MQVPTRIAMGSNLAIVFLSSFAAFLGKALTGQIAWLFAVPIIIAVLPAAYLGGLVSHKVPVTLIRRALAFFIIIAAIKVGLSAAGL